MKVNVPVCNACDKSAGISSVYGYWKCVNSKCYKYDELVAENLRAYIMVHEKWADEDGRIHK